MKLPHFHLLFLVLLLAVKAGAVENLTTSSYNSATPTSSDIANWTTGWGASGVTGWDYVGIVGDASGVYLGNNWVITAAHVGANNFTLNGTTYLMVPGSAIGIVDTTGTADLTLFQIATAPNLAALTISTSAPTVFSGSQSGSKVAMIGYGNAGGVLKETWGLNTVITNNLTVPLTGYPYVTTDFRTAYGTTTVPVGHGNATVSVANDYTLVLHDSGGGDFLYNSTTNNWNLAGINEAVDGSNNSYMVELSAYSTQINAITSVPEPSSYALIILGLGTAGVLRRWRYL